MDRFALIYLTRDDRAAQAVSWARAEQTHFWQEGDHALAGVTPRFDFDQILEFAETIEAHNASWGQWFVKFDVEPHVVQYEQLARDPVGCKGRFCISLISKLRPMPRSGRRGDVRPTT